MLLESDRLTTTNLDLIGGTPGTEDDLSETTAVWQRIYDRDKLNLPNSLLDAGLALNAIREFGYVPENVRLYIEADAKTQSLEATAPGVLHTTYQAWDGKNKTLRGY